MKKLVLSFAVGFQLFSFSCSNNVSPNFSREISFELSGRIAPGYFVSAIAFDSKGTPWLGTFEQGLIKYDGTVTVYDSRNSILPDNISIWDIAVDKSDNVWIGSTKGLIKYALGKFTIYDTSNTSMIRAFVNSVAVDNENNVWFSSWVIGKGGLMKYDGKEWTLFTPENSSLPANIVADIEVDGNDSKWIAVDGGINACSILKITGEQWSVYDEHDIGFSPYFWGNLACGPRWVHASIDYSFSSLLDTGRPNILPFDGAEWTINNPVDSSGNSLGYVGEIAVDRRGYLWASTRFSDGLAVYNGRTWSSARPEYLKNTGVFDIAVDNENTVWLGTGDGVRILRQE